MRTFNYNPKAEKEASSFLMSKNLEFTLNYLRRSHNSKRAALIDNLFSIIPEKDARRIISQLAKKFFFEGISRKKSRKTNDIEDFLSLSNDKLNNESQTIEFYDEIIELISQNWDTAKFTKNRTEIEKCAEETIQRLSKNQDDFFYKRISQMAEFFHLGQDDIDIFLVFYLIAKDSDFEDMCDNCNIRIGMLRNREDMPSKISALKRFTYLDEASIRKSLSKDGPLFKYGVIERDGDISRHIFDYLQGFNNEPLSTQYFTKFNGTAVPIEYHFSMEKHIAIIEKMIKNKAKNEAVNILLYGAPGTGKTEFCRSLAKHLSRDLYEINKIEDDDRPAMGGRFRFSALKLCQNSIDIERSIIMIDEADEMLNGGNTASFLPFLNITTRNTEKDIINDFLDTGNGVYFWITNHYRNIEESTRRRFDYSIEFKKFTLHQRTHIWRTCVAKYNLYEHFSDEEILNLAKKYELNVGGIDIALRNYMRITRQENSVPDSERKMEILDSILAPHLNLIGKFAHGTSVKPVKEYSLEGLNIKGSMPISKILDIMRNFSKE
ncbi:MAG: ATP-binding protein, partial [Candidatus Nanoarchaeia archaeon]